MISIFTALDTVSVLLDVLEEITLGISTIDEWDKRDTPFLSHFFILVDK